VFRREIQEQKRQGREAAKEVGEIQRGNKMQWIGFNLNKDGNFFKKYFCKWTEFYKIYKFVRFGDGVE
jgi:hypothetical protein